METLILTCKQIKGKTINWKFPKCASIGEWLNKIKRTKYSTAIQKCEPNSLCLYMYICKVSEYRV